MEREDVVINQVGSLDAYQVACTKHRTASASPEYCVMGLLEEAGEVAGVFKRLIRGDYDEDIASSKLHAELGDVLWYLGQIALDNGWKLSEVANSNLDKLDSRKLRGVLKGTGDER